MFIDAYCLFSLFQIKLPGLTTATLTSEQPPGSEGGEMLAPMPHKPWAIPCATVQASVLLAWVTFCNLPLNAQETSSRRLRWELKTAGGPDRFVELMAAKDTLLGLRKGVLYAFDSRSGKERWRFPKTGKATQYSDSTASHCAPFLLGIAGDEAITYLPESFGTNGQGCAAIRLSDGELTRHFDLGAAFERGNMLWRQPLLDTRAAFWKSDYETNVTTVVVFDLPRWQEVCRFDIPTPREDVHVIGDRVLGVFHRKPEPFKRAFSVDLAAGKMFTVPLRVGGRGNDECELLLPDGSRMFPEGRFSAACAYVEPTQLRFAFSGRGLVCDRPNLKAVDLVTGKHLWSVPLRWEARPSFTAASDVLAVSDGDRITVLHGESGQLRASIRIRELGETPMNDGDDWLLACDGPHVYFACSSGLKAYSTHAVDPQQPDRTDPGDPAWAIFHCRNALLGGSVEEAMHAIEGSAFSFQLRPSQREEAAVLLSQLARTDAPRLFPMRWHRLLCSDGWVAGELFLDEYVRLATDDPNAVEALHYLGTERAIRAAAAVLSNRDLTFRGQIDEVLFLAAKAEEKLTGHWPADRILSLKYRYAYRPLLRYGLDTGTVERLLPARRKQGLPPENELRALPPDQYLILTDGKGEFAEAARLQLESYKQGEGKTEDIKIVKPGRMRADEEDF